MPILLDGKEIGHITISKVRRRSPGHNFHVWRSRYQFGLDPQYGGVFHSEAMNMDEVKRMVKNRLRKYGIEVS